VRRSIERPPNEERDPVRGNLPAPDRAGLVRPRRPGRNGRLADAERLRAAGRPSVTFRTDPAPGFDGIVHCEVLELEAPSRFALSWRGGPLDTVLRIDLEPVGDRATRLRLAHTGFDGLRDALVARILGRGTRRIYGRLLPAYLDRIRPDGSLAPALPAPPMRDPISALIARIAARLR